MSKAQIIFMELEGVVKKSHQIPLVPRVSAVCTEPCRTERVLPASAEPSAEAAGGGQRQGLS